MPKKVSSIFNQFWQSLSGGGTRLFGGTQRNPGLQQTGPFNSVVKPATPVTEETALAISSVYAAVRRISDTVSTLPVRVYRTNDNGIREIQRNHSINQLLRKPNSYMNQGDLFTQIVTSLVLTGNSYSVLSRVGGVVRGILPVQPSQMIVILEDDGTLTYKYTAAGEVHILGADDVLHIKNLGNGVIGYSPLQYHAGVFGTAQAQDKLVNAIYENGGKRAGVAKIERTLTDAQKEALKANFAGPLTGQNPDGTPAFTRLLVLEGGMEFQPIDMSPSDMDLIESRKYTVSDIGRIFGVPDQLLNNGDTSWNAGTDSVIAAWYKLGLMPVLRKIERSLMRTLGAYDEGLDIEFDVDKLLRADPATRYECYTKAFQISAMTVNEIRAAENMPPVEGGDEPRCLVNVLPLAEVRSLGQHNTPSTNDTKDIQL